MSLFAKLTGINNKNTKKKEAENAEELDFFEEDENTQEEEMQKEEIIENIKKEEETKENCKIKNKPQPKEKIEKNKKSDNWDDDYEEGELSIDVFEDDGNNIVVKSTIAGVKPEDIDISVNNDMLTIRGKREYEEKVEEKNYFYRECYWGNFSRSIILPCEVKVDKISAKLKNGVLTVKLPKAKTEKKVAIKVVEE